METGNRKSGEINYVEGSNYLDELRRNQNSNKIKDNVTGVFEASYFNLWRKQAHFSGVMFWFCYGNFQGRGKDVLFLAAEPKYEFIYPKADPIIARGLSPFQEKLLLPLDVNGKNFIQQDGRSILNEKDGKPNGQTATEDKGNVLRKVYRFLSEEEFWRLNKYGHGYFEAKDYDIDFFENLLGPENESPTYLRYYIGLDENENPSQMRIFLVPADDQGNNIKVLKNPRRANKTTEPYLLQKSWPPPPDTF